MCYFFASKNHIIISHMCYACIKGHLEPTHLKSLPLFTFSTKSLGQDSPLIHLFSKIVGSSYTTTKIKLGEDSPIPKFICLKIRRRDGVESLTTLEEGEFKVPIDGCINVTIQQDILHTAITVLQGVLKFGFGRDVPPQNLKVDPYKYQFFKKK